MVVRGEPGGAIAAPDARLGSTAEFVGEPISSGWRNVIGVSLVYFVGDSVVNCV
jgi:hypothetical protein